jgi:transcriptional regulator with PAS, ATPase and Fis domain
VIELAAVMYEDNEIHEENIAFISLEKEGPSLMDEMKLREYRLKIIRHFLNKNDNHVLLVASKLDIGKSSIYRYLIEMEDEEI